MFVCCCSTNWTDDILQALREQIEALESQIVEQKEKVKAAAPDEKQLKQLEKMVAEYRKGITSYHVI